jgi:ribosome-associated protein
MPGPLVIQEGTVVPEHELRWRFSRSSGPGGQSVNTTDSRVELSLDVAATSAFSEAQRSRALRRLGSRLVGGTTITVTASEHRSQLRNREAAEQRLAQLLRAAIAPPPKPRRPTHPTKSSQARRLAAKRRRGEVKRLRRGDPE